VNDEAVLTAGRLERRADWLEARCAIAEARGERLDRDEAELSALRWAV
jgi:hypothetical protein